MASSEDKLNLLRSLLKENPNLGMKEANVVIREQFGTGVAPPQYSKVKKEFSDEITEAPSPKAEVKAEPASKTEEPKPAEEPQSSEASQDSENDLESFFDGSAAKEVQLKEEPKEEAPKDLSENDGSSLLSEDSEEKAEEVQEAEPEEQRPPAPCYPVRLEVTIPKAETVHLSGSFNKWKISEHALNKNEDGKWVFDHELPEGEHFYKFVVNSKLWHLDLDQEYFQDPTGISHKIVVSAP